MRTLNNHERSSASARSLLKDRLRSFHQNLLNSHGQDDTLKLYYQSLIEWVEHPMTHLDHIERLFEQLSFNDRIMTPPNGTGNSSARVVQLLELQRDALARELDVLRELVKAKDEVIALLRGNSLAKK